MLPRNMIWLPPVSALTMYAILYYCINQYGNRFLAAVDWGTGNELLWLSVIELLLLIVFNRVRNFMVNRVQKHITLPLPEGSVYMYLYPFFFWSAGTAVLLRWLWQLPYAPEIDSYCQLLILSAAVCILMGIALPWSAARFFILLWHARKLRPV